LDILGKEDDINKVLFLSSFIRSDNISHMNISMLFIVNFGN